MFDDDNILPDDWSGFLSKYDDSGFLQKSKSFRQIGFGNINSQEITKNST